MSTLHLYSLAAKERLKGKKIIDALFANRQAVKAYPFILIYKEIPRKEVPVLFGVSVTKKKFRRAVDRNLIKRLIREVYRHEKGILYSALEKRETTFAIMFLYIGSTISTQEVLQGNMKTAIQKFVNDVL